MPAQAERSPRRRAGRAILDAVVVLAVTPAYLALSPPWQPVAVHLACAAIVIAGCVRVLRLARSAMEAAPPSPLDAPPPPAAARGSCRSTAGSACRGSRRQDPL